MKTIIYSIILLILIFQPSFSQNVEIPDTSFLSALIEKGVDTNGDELISVEEAAAVTYLDVSGEMECQWWICTPIGEITSLKGIETFINLDTLICSANLIDSLDLSKNTFLRYLDCSLNKRKDDTVRYLKSLKVTECSALTYLDCSSNGLKSLDVTKNTELLNLNCSNNNLLELDISKNSKLTGLSCSGNQVATLDLSQNIHLGILECGGNQFASLDVTACKSLISLECGSESLTNLNLSGISIKKFTYTNGQLIHLDVSDCKDLKQLECSGNQLTSLDISNCESLSNLSCGGNLLETLDISSCQSLKYLSCTGNKLSGLDLNGNTVLTHLYCSDNKLTNIDLSNNKSLYKLYCINNQLNSLELSSNPNVMELMCMENELSSLDLSSNISLNNLFCSNNPLTILVLPNSIDSLEIKNMPPLTQVCVEELPSPDKESWNSEGSPNVLYTTNCEFKNEGSTTNTPRYDSAVRIYPNPANDFLIIQADKSGPLTIKIFSLNGELIFRTVCNTQSKQINISSLERGVYLINVASDKFTIIDKVVKL